MTGAFSYSRVDELLMSGSSEADSQELWALLRRMSVAKDIDFALYTAYHYLHGCLEQYSFPMMKLLVQSYETFLPAGSQIINWSNKLDQILYRGSYELLKYAIPKCSWVDLSRRDHLLSLSRANPDPRVPAYFCLIVESGALIRMKRSRHAKYASHVALEQWILADEALDRYPFYLSDSSSYLHYLPRDLQLFCIRPYLQYFYLSIHLPKAT